MSGAGKVTETKGGLAWDSAGVDPQAARKDRRKAMGTNSPRTRAMMHDMQTANEQHAASTIQNAFRQHGLAAMSPGAGAAAMSPGAGAAAMDPGAGGGLQRTPPNDREKELRAERSAKEQKEKERKREADEFRRQQAAKARAVQAERDEGLYPTTLHLHFT